MQDALDEIEYVTGDTNTNWGAQRAKDGHPAPFTLTYVEIGNEDWFDRPAVMTDGSRSFTTPSRRSIPSCKSSPRSATNSPSPASPQPHAGCAWTNIITARRKTWRRSALDYDKYSRTNKTKIFVGEWATRVGSPTPNMAGALGDAAWMTGMERNSDIVVMSSYAPLFVNVSELSGRTVRCNGARI